MFYWFLKWVAIGPLLRVIFRPVVQGEENVPEEGPAILASNHLSYADWLFMPLTLPRRVTFVAKAEYFTSPGIKGWFKKKFFSGAGQVPIDRGGANAAEGAHVPQHAGRKVGLRVGPGPQPAAVAARSRQLLPLIRSRPAA